MGSDATDEELMARHVRGDATAFPLLHARWAAKLRNLFVRGGLRGDDANDMVQQTFLQLHRARADFREGSSLRPWIYTIALNLRRQLTRRQLRKPEQPIDDAEEVGRGLDDDEVDIDAQLDAQVDGRHLRAAMSRLPEAQREVIMLHWFEGLSFREVAAIVGATPVAVKVRAHRGYARLRALLEAAGVTGVGAPSYAPEED